MHTVKDFGIVNKAKADVFLELSCFFDNPTDVGNLISGSSAFFKSSLNVWKFKVHILLKPGLENFEDYFTSVRDECNCAVVWTFFSIAFLWDWNENWPFPVRCCKEQYCIGTRNVRFMHQGKTEVVKQEMARVNVDILGISELKWTGMGEFNS